MILMIIAVSPGVSQTSEIRNLNDLSDQYTIEKSKRNFMMEHAEVEGTPYLNEAFVPGEVVINDSIIYSEIPMRYNIYNDRIEFQNNERQILEVDITEQFWRFSFGPHEFMTVDYVDRGTERRGILELLVNGHIQLYKQYLVHFKNATKEIGYQEAQPNRFIRQEDEYLIAIKQGKPETFRNSKELMEKLTLINPDIEQYKKSQKLKLRSENDLIMLIQYCNN